MAIDESEFRALVKEVQELRKSRDQLNHLLDRQAILDTINRYTHAVDRHDWDMLHNEVFHPDGIGDYGAVVGSSRDIAARLDARYESDYLIHTHVIGNHLCEIDGNTAHAETYVVTYGLMKDGKSLRSSHGRYVDRLEKRDGKWKIALRRIIGEANSTIQTLGDPAPGGKWDRTDPSCERPLTLPPDRAALIRR